ncbi:MAG: hypothetical protein COA79_26395 [Planctomycetota bacterium]|nr:MAG: hypothetical protein COA79_26395 [Planctomycetota bacterium]
MKTYNIPELPLPFNNTKLQKLILNDKCYYICSAYSNHQPALLVFDENNQYKSIKLPYISSYLEVYNDKVICGNECLLSVDIISGDYEVISKPLGISDGPWGGMIHDNFAILGCSEINQDIVIFDLDKRIIVKRIPAPKDSYYIYQATLTHDNQILISGSVPKVSFILVNPTDWSHKVFYPNIPEEHTFNYNNIFIDKNTLFFNTNISSFTLTYPNFEIIHEAKWPDDKIIGVNQRQTTTFKGLPIMWDGEGSNFYYFDPINKDFTKLNKEPIDFKQADNGIAGFLETENHHIIGLKTNGTCFEVSENGDVTIRENMQAYSTVKGWGMFLIESKNQKKLLGCSHCIQHLWEIDLKENSSSHVGKSGPGGGQINAMDWDQENEILYLASYSTCTLMNFKPGIDEIPQKIIKLEKNQVRPLAMKFYKNELWTITLAKLGSDGGALTCYNIDTKELNYFMDILEEQSPQSLLIDHNNEVLYLSLSIYPEGAPPKRSVAGLIHFDLKDKSVAHYSEPISNAETIHFFTFLPNGNLLIQDQKYLSKTATLFEYDPSQMKLTKLGESPENLREIILDNRTGQLYGVCKKGVFNLTINNQQLDFKYIAETQELTPNKNSMPKYINISQDGEIYVVLDDKVISLVKNP